MFLWMLELGAWSFLPSSHCNQAICIPESGSPNAFLYLKESDFERHCGRERRSEVP
jgi:hypothetical protein